MKVEEGTIQMSTMNTLQCTTRAGWEYWNTTGGTLMQEDSAVVRGLALVVLWLRVWEASSRIVVRSLVRVIIVLGWLGNLWRQSG